VVVLEAPKNLGELLRHAGLDEESSNSPVVIDAPAEAKQLEEEAER
jgi:hypothetical protein